MARTDTLPHFLTDVADAIRTKTGSSDTIQASTFDTAIANIPSGGGAVEEKDVNFYDYDGTLLHSYTAQEFATLESMPENPDRTSEGLTAQGWNWSLANAKSYVANNTYCDIGQNYVTSDGATKLFISVYDGRLSLYLGFAVNGTATIDWGDQNTETVTGSSTSTNILTPHTYAQEGDYVISISSQNKIYFIGDSSVYSRIITNGTSSSDSYQRPYHMLLTKIYFGSNVELGTLAIAGNKSLKFATMPNDISISGNQAFNLCINLLFIVLPSGINLRTSAFSGCTGLEGLIFPDVLTGFSAPCSSCYGLRKIVLPVYNYSSYGSEPFSGCNKLEKIVFPKTAINIPINLCSNKGLLSHFEMPTNATSIPDYCFNSSNLREIEIPNGITSIGQYAFNACPLSLIVIPKNVSNLKAGCFRYCNGVKYYDFSNHTTIPTVTTSSFDNNASDMKIVVPDSLYETWVTTGNWPTYSSYIIKKTDWDALQNA